MPGTASNPVRLDPWQRISSVGWGKSNIIVLGIICTDHNTYTQEIPPIPNPPVDHVAVEVGADLQNLSSNSEVLDISNGEIFSPGSGPAISQIVTGAMLARYLVWTYSKVVTIVTTSNPSRDLTMRNHAFINVNKWKAAIKTASPGATEGTFEIKTHTWSPTYYQTGQITLSANLLTGQRDFTVNDVGALPGDSDGFVFSPILQGNTGATVKFHVDLSTLVLTMDAPVYS